MFRGHIEWPSFEWMHVDCFPGLIQLACLLPEKEDNLRNRITKVAVSDFSLILCVSRLHFVALRLRSALKLIADLDNNIAVFAGCI